MTNCCIICLVPESSTRLFSLQAAQNEDRKRYEQLTGLKIQRLAFICQRCSVDLGMAVILKQKAIESSKYFDNSLQIASLASKAPVTNKIPQSINKVDNVVPSTNKIVHLNEKDSKPQQTPSIISSQVIDPPLDIRNIANLFKSNPNVTVIRKSTGVNIKEPIKHVEVEKMKGKVEKVPTNEGSKLKQRRFSVCADKYFATQKEATQRTAQNFNTNKSFSRPTKFFVNKDTEKPPVSAKKPKNEKRSLNADESNENQKKKPKTSLDSNLSDEMSPNSTGKGKKFKVAGSQQKRYNTRQKADSKPQNEFQVQYWINSSVKGYYIETFNDHEEAMSYLEKLPEQTTFGPLI